MSEEKRAVPEKPSSQPESAAPGGLRGACPAAAAPSQADAPELGGPHTAGPSPLLPKRGRSGASHVPSDAARVAPAREYVLAAPGEPAHGAASQPEGVWATLPRYVCGRPQEGFRQATRPSSRAIVFNDDGTLLLSTTDECHEYVFAGGEIERGETDLAALVREVEEETGWLVDAASARPVLSIDDYHNRQDACLSMRQANRYFVCRVRPGGTMHLDKYEAVAGLQPALVGLDEAIRANEAILARKRLFWVERDTFVLKLIRDDRGLFGL